MERPQGLQEGPGRWLLVGLLKPCMQSGKVFLKRMLHLLHSQEHAGRGPIVICKNAGFRADLSMVEGISLGSSGEARRSSSWQRIAGVMGNLTRSSVWYCSLTLLIPSVPNLHASTSKDMWAQPLAHLLLWPQAALSNIKRGPNRNFSTFRYRECVIGRCGQWSTLCSQQIVTLIFPCPYL